MAPKANTSRREALALYLLCARGAKLVLISDTKGVAKLGARAEMSMVVPDIDATVAPILYTVAVQLLAYYTALPRRADVDQPRNLAKRVTVE